MHNKTTTYNDGIDPEVANGVDSSPYPRPMSFQFGISLNF